MAEKRDLGGNELTVAIATVIALALALTLLPISPGDLDARGGCPCPAGTAQAAKAECEGEEWTWAEGGEGFSVTGDCRRANIEGDYDALAVKAGQRREEQESPVRAIDEKDISRVNVCVEGATAVALSRFGGAGERMEAQVLLPALGLACLALFLAWWLLEVTWRGR